MDICAVVLAGGKSSRMGRDKALLQFGWYDTLVEYQYRKLEAIFDKVYISSKEDKFDFDVDIIYDKYSHCR
ncbi:MAG: NTP transferase domain-containing protein [Campylobacteraceae bacterium]|nr:NTP transferase domain-containing protein [Campylobacteraceae bacterium]